MRDPETTIRFAVDPTNPGQFFACCGLLEMADRLWPGAEGWFAQEDREYRISGGGLLSELLRNVKTTTFAAADGGGEDDEAGDEGEK